MLSPPIMFSMRWLRFRLRRDITIRMTTRAIVNPPAAEADTTTVVSDEDCWGWFTVTLMHLLYGPIPAVFDADTRMDTASAVVKKLRVNDVVFVEAICWTPDPHVNGTLE